jgi:sulfur carrier protein ThiS adenylyltransferase
MHPSDTVLEQGLRHHLSARHLTRLGSTRVGIAGVGGLGSNVAMHLVRCGIRNLVLADGDRVAPSNLNRQFFFPDQVGQTKVRALADTLVRLAPNLDLALHDAMLTRADATSVFAGCPVVVEALDEREAKKMLVETLLPTGCLVIGASGIGGYGQPETITVRRLHRGLILVGDGCTPADQDYPPMSPRVGIVAAMQADLVLAHLLGSCTLASAKEEP